MATPRRAWAPGKAAILLVAIATGVSCGTGATGTGATHSATAAAASPSPHASPSASAMSSPSPNPSTSPNPSPVAINGAYGLLVALPSSGQYTVTLVGIEGKVAASAQASSPANVTCANAAAALVAPPVSTSNTRAYFMDAKGDVRFLAPNDTVSPAPIINLPAGTASRRSMFAVSPDDTMMAVVVDDFTSSGADTKVYIDQLNLGGSQNLIFTQTGAYTLWPIGWHGTNNLVLAKVPACTQGGGPGCCGPQEFHVVDPTTAVRRFTIGGPQCIIAGPPSPAGSVCEDTNFTMATTLDWTAVKRHTAPITGPSAAYIAPSTNGGVQGITVVAFVFGADTVISGTSRRFSGMQACGWIDDTHLLAGGDTQHQPRVGDVTTGNIVPVATTGDCAGRIPGGL